MSQPLVAFLLIVSGFLAGVVGAALTYFTILRFLKDFEYRLTDVEERVVREVKARANFLSKEKHSSNDQLEKWAAEQRPPAQKSLLDWQRDKMVGK